MHPSLEILEFYSPHMFYAEAALKNHVKYGHERTLVLLLSLQECSNIE